MGGQRKNSLGKPFGLVGFSKYVAIHFVCFFLSLFLPISFYISLGKLSFAEEVRCMGLHGPMDMN